MTLSVAEIETVVDDLRPKLEGGRIERIDQPDDRRLVLHVRRGPSRYWLLISAHPQFSRLHLLTRRPQEGRPASGLGNVVRQHLTAALIRRVHQIPDERVVIVEAITRDRMQRAHTISLVAELTGVAANIVVVGQSGRVLGLLRRYKSRRRDVAPGRPYEPPPSAGPLPEKAQVDRFRSHWDAGDPLSISRAIQSHYALLEADEAAERMRGQIGSALRRALARLRRRLGKVRRELAVAQDAESIRRRGELLKIALPLIQPGQREVLVEDLFDPARAPITIELDTTRSAQDNVGLLFKRYKKAKAGRDRVRARLAQTEAEIATARMLQGELAGAGAHVQLTDLKQRIRQAGIPLPEDGSRPAVRAEPSGPRRFQSQDGFEILVARNSRENDRLTFSLARGNDSWLHLRDWPSPHVIVRRPRDRDISHEALLDAAHLAVHFSKIRGADYAEVACTQVKYVRRTRGASPGRVNYANATTLQLRVEAGRLARLLARRMDRSAGTS